MYKIAIISNLPIIILKDNIILDIGFKSIVVIPTVKPLLEIVVAASNTGLSIGITTMDLDSISKMILSFNMIMGRFEIIAILYIFISKLRR